MISYPEALRRLGEIVPRAGMEECPIEKAAGRILRQSVAADREFPPFDRVMMDGYALRHADWAAGVRAYRVTGIAPAGNPVVALGLGTGSCVEVMTGAPRPDGADCIVPVEEVSDLRDGFVHFLESAGPVAGKYIHRAGSDAAEGAVLLGSGRLLGAREMGVAASCGAAWLDVAKLPDIAVLATGDELVAVDAIPQAHQIRQSNAVSLAAALQRAGCPPRCVGVLGDDVSKARSVLKTLLAENEWIVLTGAVSKGRRDFLPALFEESGCGEIFHRIAQRPAHPAGCWQGPQGQVIIALPGNPVSALIGLHVLVLPALAAAGFLTEPVPRLVACDAGGQAIPGSTRHLPVKLAADGRGIPAPPGNSGDFIGLLASDGFVTLPPREEVAGTSAFPFIPWI